MLRAADPGQRAPHEGSRQGVSFVAVVGDCATEDRRGRWFGTAGDVSFVKLDAALSYAWQGVPVFPVHSIVNGDCTCSPTSKKRGPDGRCREAGKHPRNHRGSNDATTDEWTIRAWWAKWPDANIGGVTGLASKRIVIDVDLHGEVDGFARLAELEAEHGVLPPTRVHRTGGGGEHRIFRYEAGVHSRHFGGVDLLSDGGFIVLPPSVHKSGQCYEIAEARPEARLPIGWRRAFGKQASGLPRWLPAVIEVGTRDATLFKLACYLRRYGATAAAIETVLRQVANERVVQPFGDEIGDDRLRQIALDVERKYQPTSIVPMFSRWEAMARSWTDGHAPTDRRVLGAIIDIARMRHARGLVAFDLELPVRAVAERAMVAKETVTEALARLAGQRGLLVCLHRYHPTFHPNGAIYRLLQPQDVSSDLHTPRETGESGPISVGRRKHHDLFRKGRGGLGWLSGDVYWILDAATPARLCDLNARLGRPERLRGSVSKALSKLEKHGLAIPGDGGWLLGSADLDAVAEALGVAGRTEKQKERHRAEREVYRSPADKATRRRNAEERKRLAEEVCGYAGEVGYVALPSRGVVAGHEAWSEWTRSAKRKELVGALVELRQVQRATVLDLAASAEVRPEAVAGKAVPAGVRLVSAARSSGRKPTAAPATRSMLVDRRGGATARSVSRGAWKRSSRTPDAMAG